MSLRINHNVSAINAHRNLNTNDVRLGSSLEKLSSGLKINRAADGPASLVISEQMRAQIAGLRQAVDNSEGAVSVVQTAEGALHEVASLLVSMRQLAIHAANEGVNDEVMLNADQQEIENSLSSINRIAEQTQFGTKKLLDGSFGAAGTTTGGLIEFLGAGTAAKDSGIQGYAVQVTQTASQSQLAGQVTLDDSAIKAGEKLTVIENGKTASYTSSRDDSAETVAANFQVAINEAGLEVDVKLDTTGRMQLTSRKFGSGEAFQASSSTAGVLSQDAGEISNSNAGQDVKGLINGEVASGQGLVLTGNEGNTATSGLKIKLDESFKIPADQAADAVDVGRVYLTQKAMKFQVGGNAHQTVEVELQSTHASQLARAVDNQSGFTSLADINVLNHTQAQDAIGLLDSAINEVSQVRAELGAFQKNTLESNLSNLRVAEENLTHAESQIRDLDMAREMASFTRSQIMTQSATAMLAQANQSPQQVLALLG